MSMRRASDIVFLVAWPRCHAWRGGEPLISFDLAVGLGGDGDPIRIVLARSPGIEVLDL